MRIAYICQYQGPDAIASRGIVRNRSLGGNRKIEMIADALVEAGHEVLVLSGGVPADRTMRAFQRFESTIGARPGGARVIYATGLDVPVANLLMAIFSTVRTARRQARAPFDLILIYNVTEYTIAVAAAIRRVSGETPIVLEYEDSVEMASRGISAIRRTLWQRLERWVRPRVRGVFAVNAALPERIGCANALILRGLVSDSFCARAASRPRPFSGGRTVAFFSGSLSPEKGLGRLLELVPRFAGRVRFVVSGAGPMEPMLRKAAARWPEDLEIAGLISREALEQKLLTADILLNPHDDDVGAIFPFKVIEYLASGGVVVTTKCGIESDPAFDFCELASTGSFGDAVQRVLDEPEQTAERADRGRIWAAANYSSSAVRRGILSVIDTAAASRPRLNDPRSGTQT